MQLREENGENREGQGIHVHPRIRKEELALLNRRITRRVTVPRRKGKETKRTGQPTSLKPRHPPNKGKKSSGKHLAAKKRKPPLEQNWGPVQSNVYRRTSGGTSKRKKSWTTQSYLQNKLGHADQKLPGKKKQRRERLATVAPAATLQNQDS